MAEEKPSLSVKTGLPRIHRTNITNAITTGINRSACVVSQISISPILIAGCPSQNPQYSLFHLLCLCGGFFEA